jgi:ribosomal protein S18 acetylase RimI-like enzyme
MPAAALEVPFSVWRGSDEITTSRTRLDVAVIHEFLTESYWSPGIPRETVERALDCSLNFGLYRTVGNSAGDSVANASRQIGFARVVTDGVTFAYVADVFVLPDFRGAGLAKWLVSTALTHPALQGLRRVLLATKDAHEIYARCGFTPLARPERFMEINRPDIYRNTPNEGID